MQPGPALLVTIPTAAVVITAAVLLGPGAGRPAIGARVLGAPAVGARSIALRIEAARLHFGVEDTAPIPALRVRATVPGLEIPPWTGATGPDGVADVQLEAPAPIHDRLGLVVEDMRRPDRPVVLALGSVPIEHGRAIHRSWDAINGNRTGDLGIKVIARRGQLAAPFPEELRIQVLAPGSETRGPESTLELHGSGIQLSQEKIRTDRFGEASVRVTALMHQVELTIKATADEKSGTWEGTLPVVPGAAWIAPPAEGADATLEVVAPSPREREYVSLWDERGRIFGAAVPLARDDRGFFRGKLAIPASITAKEMIATVASDSAERGPSTVAWSIRPPDQAVKVPRLAVLLDWTQEAMDREKQRAWHARRAGLLVIGIAAVVEVLLLVLRGRDAQRTLDAHLERAIGSDDDAAPPVPEADRAKLLASAREHPVLWALLFTSIVAFAFAAVGAMATFR